MNKLAVSSDFHISSSYPFTNSANPLQDIFFLKMYSAIKQIAVYLQENNIDMLHGADLFDKEEISSLELFVANKFFDGFTNNNLQLFLNIGNHEQSYAESIPSVINILTRRYKNIHVPSYDKWTCYSWNGLMIYLIPYYKESIFNEVLEEVVKQVDGPSALCIHQNIKGIKLGNTSIKDGFDEGDLIEKLKDKFKFIVCGHLHHSYYSAKYGIPLIIPGSIHSIDFKDENSLKSFYVLNLNKSYDVINHQQVFIRNQIVFSTIHLNDITPEFAKSVKNKYIKIRHPLDYTDEFNRIRKDFLKAGAINVVPDLLKRDHEVDLSTYERPVDWNIDDWLKKFLNNHCEDSDMHHSVMELNKELFSDEVYSPTNKRSVLENAQ